MSEFTLYEAMEAVEEYLQESGKGFHRYVKRMHDMSDEVMDSRDRANRIMDYAINEPNSKKKAMLKNLAKSFNKKSKDINKHINQSYRGSFGRERGNGPSIALYTAGFDLMDSKAGKDSRRSITSGGKTNMTNMVSLLRNDLKSTQKGPDNRPITDRYPAFKKSIKKESVEDLDALKLQVYEAFDEGLIDVEEKMNMLNLLDINNYEIED